MLHLYIYSLPFLLCWGSKHANDGDYLCSRPLSQARETELSWAFLLLCSSFGSLSLCPLMSRDLPSQILAFSWWIKGSGSVVCTEITVSRAHVGSRAQFSLMKAIKPCQRCPPAWSSGSTYKGKPGIEAHCLQQRQLCPHSRLLNSQRRKQVNLEQLGNRRTYLALN